MRRKIQIDSLKKQDHERLAHKVKMFDETSDLGINCSLPKEEKLNLHVKHNVMKCRCYNLQDVCEVSDAEMLTY
jgi:hypothetical protein